MFTKFPEGHHTPGRRRVFLAILLISNKPASHQSTLKKKQTIQKPKKVARSLPRSQKLTGRRPSSQEDKTQAFIQKPKHDKNHRNPRNHPRSPRNPRSIKKPSNHPRNPRSPSNHPRNHHLNPFESNPFFFASILVPRLPLHRCNSDPPPSGRRAGGSLGIFPKMAGGLAEVYSTCQARGFNGSFYLFKGLQKALNFGGGGSLY